MSENRKDKWLTVRISEVEYNLIKKQFQKTTERKLSAYARKILLGEPMVKVVRNASLQDIVIVLSRMQKDLNGLTNNYNQMVHKLHISDTKAELLAWIQLYEKEKKLLFLQIDIISAYIKKSGKLWLQ